MGGDRPTVLVVDDEPDVTEVYAMWLDDDYDVRTANGGLEALDKVGPDVDVVLLDRRMPAMSGDEVLERIGDKGLDPKVAMVSAVDPDFDIADMAFDAYLTKPVMPGDLNEVVERLLYLDRMDFEHKEVREGHRLKEKREALEREKTREELEDSEVYDEITERLHELRDDVEETVEDVEQRSRESAADDATEGADEDEDDGPDWQAIPDG